MLYLGMVWEEADDIVLSMSMRSYNQQLKLITAKENQATWPVQIHAL